MHGMHKSDAPSGKLLLLSLDWPSSFWPFKRTGLTEKEEEWITNFSCRDARCFKPADRAAVLEAIRERFGSEELFDEARPARVQLKSSPTLLSSPNSTRLSSLLYRAQFVHTHLLTVLERSKRQYARQLWGVAGESFGLVFAS